MVSKICAFLVSLILTFTSNIEYIVENINSKSKQSALKYENGVILVISDEDIAELKNKSNYIQDLINSTCSDYILGISIMPPLVKTGFQKS